MVSACRFVFVYVCERERVCEMLSLWKITRSEKYALKFPCLVVHMIYLQSVNMFIFSLVLFLKPEIALKQDSRYRGKKTKLNVRHIWVPLCWCSIQTVYSRSLQSRDRLEDLEGKASIELQHKNVNSSSISQPQIFRTPLKRVKRRYFWTKCKFWPFAIHIKHLQQYFNNKPCDKTL